MNPCQSLLVGRPFQVQVLVAGSVRRSTKSHFSVSSGVQLAIASNEATAQSEGRVCTCVKGENNDCSQARLGLEALKMLRMS